MLDNIKKMYLITFLSNLQFFGSLVVPFFMDWGHLDYSGMFTLESFFMLSIFLFQIPTGILADKYGRKISLAAGVFLSAVSLLLLTSYPSFLMFVFAEILAGCGVAFTSGADNALIFDTLRKTKNEKTAKQVFANCTLASSAAFIISFPVGSFIAGQKFMPYPDILTIPFILSAATMALAGVIALFLYEAREKRNGESFIELGTKSLLEVWSNKPLLSLALDMTMISITSFFMFWFYQSLLRNAEVGISWWGWVAAAFNLVAMILLWKLTSIEKRVGTSKLLFFSALAIGLFYLVLGTSSSLWISISAIFVITNMRFMRQPLFTHYINSHLGSKRRATVLSAIGMMEKAGIAILYPLIGVISDISLQLAFLVLGIATITFALLFRSNEASFEKE